MAAVSRSHDLSPVAVAHFKPKYLVWSPPATVTVAHLYHCVSNTDALPWLPQLQTKGGQSIIFSVPQIHFVAGSSNNSFNVYFNGQFMQNT